MKPVQGQLFVSGVLGDGRSSYLDQPLERVALKHHGVWKSLGGSIKLLGAGTRQWTKVWRIGWLLAMWSVARLGGDIDSEEYE